MKDRSEARPLLLVSPCWWQPDLQLASDRQESGLLADVTPVPRQVFPRGTSWGVSYEVEDSCSVPCVWDDPDEIVHQLLTGRNHHNENPLLIWQVLFLLD
ncbi:unnamed protein product [Triticum turgidum subsp. durum]|uniref:Uncharacterized protein n=1 Tax=Triticum turgidum subsp. durum TaxID=4567 RepID=A0A9R0X9Q8_TRITD|nr:unnamed protein product [Triticum turgidum subsp. durum]